MKKYTCFLLALVCIVMQSRAQWYNSSTLTNAGSLVTDINGQGHNTATGVYSTSGSVGAPSSYGVFNHMGLSGTGTNAAFINDGAYDASINGRDYFKGPGGTAGQQEIAGSTMPVFGELYLQNGAAAPFNISNANGIRIATAISFENGITTTVRSNTAAGAIQLDDNAVFSNTALSDAQHVNGYVTKKGDDAFTFPVGSGTDLRTLSIAAPADTSDAYSVAWIAGDPSIHADPSDGGAMHLTNTHTAPITSVSPAGQWDWIAVSGMGAGLAISVSIPDVSGTGAAAPDLRLAGWNGSSWVDLSGGATATGTAEGSILSGTMQPGITAIGIGTVGTAPLAVKLISFTAEAKSCAVFLAWETAAENNNAYFGVERSVTGKDWATIGTVQASGNHGALTSHYSFTDAAAPQGNLYYRLRQTDIDGKENFSPVVASHTDCNAAIQVYPNPTHDYINVNGAVEGSEIQLVNTLGQVMLRQPVQAVNSRVSMAGMVPGLYWVCVLKDNTATGQYKVTYIR